MITTTERLTMLPSMQSWSSHKRSLITGNTSQVCLLRPQSKNSFSSEIAPGQYTVVMLKLTRLFSQRDSPLPPQRLQHASPRCLARNRCSQRRLDVLYIHRGLSQDVLPQGRGYCRRMEPLHLSVGLWAATCTTVACYSQGRSCTESEYVSHLAENFATKSCCGKEKSTGFQRSCALGC